VDITKSDYLEHDKHAFPRAQFLVHGVLPAPAL